MIPTIIHCCPVVSDDLTDLEEQVNNQISSGWQPFGQLFAVPPNERTDGFYVQPMVRYADRSEPERPARTPIEHKNTPAGA